MTKPEDDKLIKEINENKKSGNKAKSKLETDEKVLARVTDGIYRVPGSAIRELISNSYDADAENVIIETDMPRFGTMTIRDDGNGMSIDTLVNMLNHIGGSAKRNVKGKSLKVTSENDLTLSPIKNRKLIGKIGIGLFSVAQLTRSFTIVTKRMGDNFYLKANINLHNFSEENINKNSVNNRGESFETGTVEIWTEETNNIDIHGTDIILKNIKKTAQDQLKSVEIWGQEDVETQIDEESDEYLNSSKLEKPKYHIGIASGEIGYESYDKEEQKPSLPWKNTDRQDNKFNQLYDEIIKSTNNQRNPKLNLILDNYLKMLWDISLSVPLDYIDKHPFKYKTKEFEHKFIISNKRKGQVSEINSTNETFQNLLNLSTKTENINFNVVIDGVKLYRPIRLTNLPESKAAVKSPIMFIGSYRPNLSQLNKFDTGGNLSFESYILWCPKVVPKDHNGVMIRLHNASGVLFDETFMKHQVAENTIKGQLIVEIYINEGFDSALNIDRESFNTAHPHYQMIMRWLHQAVRQVVNKYKKIKKNKIQENNKYSQKKYNSQLENLVIEAYKKNGLDHLEKSNLIIFDENESKEKSYDSYEIKKSDYINITKTSNTNTSKSNSLHKKTEAILQTLEAYKVLDKLSLERQESLTLDILSILSYEGGSND